MAKLLIMYELVQNTNDGQVELIQFGLVLADLGNDQQIDNHRVFKNKDAYEVITFVDTFSVKVLAGSNNLDYSWTLKIWTVDQNGVLVKMLTPVPITKHVNSAGRADYEGEIKWR